MRCPIAITMLLMMLAASLAPLAVATFTTPTPACCRAAGPHHCSAEPVPGVQFRGQPCPHRKPLIFPGSTAPQPGMRAVAPADTHPFLHEFYPELFLSDAEQPHPGRSPPASSLK